MKNYRRIEYNHTTESSERMPSRHLLELLEASRRRNKNMHPRLHTTTKTSSRIYWTKIETAQPMGSGHSDRAPCIRHKHDHINPPATRSLLEKCETSQSLRDVQRLSRTFEDAGRRHKHRHKTPGHSNTSTLKDRNSIKSTKSVLRYTSPFIAVR